MQEFQHHQKFLMPKIVINQYYLSKIPLAIDYIRIRKTYFHRHIFYSIHLEYQKQSMLFPNQFQFHNLKSFDVTWYLLELDVMLSHELLIEKTTVGVDDVHLVLAFYDVCQCCVA